MESRELEFKFKVEHMSPRRIPKQEGAALVVKDGDSEIQMVLWTFLVRRECWKMITLKVLSHIFGVSVMRRTSKGFVLCIYVKVSFI